jgi:hypothetical protein
MQNRNLIRYSHLGKKVLETRTVVSSLEKSSSVTAWGAFMIWAKISGFLGKDLTMYGTRNTVSLLFGGT